ncbi:hypothetical protein GE061_019214 [Apolygus lucorum]|uniref:Uncharacterized protein n=1 Tax=Apolygus lucorum TaxID=248454 RepID=A0A6A4JW66_APOLU|nr:hypothetical protein GE061_019214 [Apolygus lucorum]
MDLSDQKDTPSFEHVIIITRFSCKYSYLIPFILKKKNMTFRVPKIKSCCCFTLETGTKIIGCLDLLVGLALFVIIIWYSYEHGMTLRHMQKGVQETMFLQWFVMDLVMTYGAFKRNHVLLFPWILFQTVMLSTLLFSLFGNIVYLGLMDVRSQSMTVEFIGSCISLFPALLVYNFYRNLREEERIQI